MQILAYIAHFLGYLKARLLEKSSWAALVGGATVAAPLYSQWPIAAFAAFAGSIVVATVPNPGAE